MRTRIMTAAAMLALAALAGSASAQELLNNGDFEQGVLNQDGAPGWQTFNFTSTNGEYARTEGGKSFKAFGPFFNADPPPGSVGLQSAAATPGTSYTLTGFMFSPTPDRIQGSNVGILELRYQDSDLAVIPGSGVTELFTSSSPVDTWVPYTITSVAPANAVFAQVVIGHIQINAPVTGGAVWWDDLSLVETPAPSGSTWIATGSGGWLSASNWQNGLVPNSVGAVANFGSAILTPSTVTIAGAGVTSGTVNFDNANAYTIAGPGALTLDVASGNAALTVISGSHAINAPLVVNDSTTATVATGSTLTIGGTVTVASGSQLSKAGGGVLAVNADLGTNAAVAADAGEVRFGASQRIASLSIAAGATATLSDGAAARVIRTPTLSIATGATLELADNGLIVDYTTTSPLAAVRAAVEAGNAGGFAGTGIVSSEAAADPRYAVGYAEASAIGSPTTFLGESGIDATTVLVLATLKGDANLSGVVNFADLLSLAQNYNGTGKVWSDGDSTYDGAVNFADLLALAQNYNQTALTDVQAAQLGEGFAADFALARSLVPEPAGVAMLTVAIGGLIRRRRR